MGTCFSTPNSTPIAEEVVCKEQDLEAGVLKEVKLADNKSCVIVKVSKVPKINPNFYWTLSYFPFLEKSS